MYSLNRAELIGNLTADPEIKQFQNGNEIASFSVATNYTYKDQTGEKHDKPEYHRIVAFGKLADIIKKYLKKGSKVFVDGRLQTRSWEAEDGTKRFMTEIVLQSLIMLSSKSPESGKKFENDEPGAEPVEYKQEDAATLDDLPF